MARPIAGLTLSLGSTSLGTLNVPVTGIETVDDYFIHVTGTVSSSNPEYFTHIIHSNLIVKIYEVVFDSSPVLITSTNVKNDHTFEKDITTKATAILVRLYLTEGGEFLVTESTYYCRHKDVHVPFEIEESLFGATVFDKVSGRLNAHGVNNPTTIANLTAAQINQLSALTCVTTVTLDRFKNAYLLWNTFVSLNPFTGMYEIFGIPANNFATSPNTATAALNGRQLFFALLRGFPYGTLNDILARSREQFQEALDISVAKHEIDASFNTTANVTALVNSRNVFLFNANDDGRYYDAKLIHLSPTNSPTEKETILNDALNGGRLSAIVAASGNSTPLTRVIPLIQLSEYVYNYAPMVTRAIASGSIGTDPNYHTLTGLGTGPWTTAMTTGGGWVLPSGYSTNADYANAIWGGISANYPGARTAVNLAASGLTAYSSLVTPLNNNPTFNIEQTNVRNFFVGGSGAVNFLAEADMLKMETLQRAVKYTDGALGSFSDVAILINGGWTSAAGIMWEGYDGFYSGAVAAGMTQAVAKKVWCYAQAVYNTSVGTAIHYAKYEGGQSYMPRVLRDNELNLPVGSLPSGLPNLESLFGTFNTCSCKECQSIYSPAAYLTDLMNWLRRQKNTTPGDSGLTTLEYVDGFERRRDIRYLLLSCENTNTMLPYIDIVNEILSVNLYPETNGGTPPSTYTWTTWLSEKYAELQTTKTAEEILVEPEHRFPVCEALLKDYKFTWALPYDVPYDETFSYLKAFGKEYHEIVLDLSSWTDKYATTQWANGYLGISPNEGSLITTNNSGDTNFWTVHYGISPNAAPTVIKPLFKATKLDYEELQEVYYTNYVWSTSGINILLNGDDTCDVDNYYFDPTPLTTAVADRLMRFLRLQKKTKLSTAELDTAIYNGGSGIDSAFIKKLAAQLHFSEKFGINFFDLQTWFGSQVYFKVGGSTVYSDYYNGRFKSALLPQAVFTFFNITAGSNYAGNVDLSALTNADKQMLSVVLNSSIIAIDEILIYINQPTSKLTPAMLAKIDSYTQIINKFGIKEGELANTLNLLVNPLAGSSQIKDAMVLSNKLSVLKALGLDINTLRDIAEGSGDYDITSIAQIAAAQAVWDDVEKAFQESRKANPSKDVVNDNVFFMNVVRESLGVPFGLSMTLTNEIVTNSYSTLFATFITNPDAARSMSTTFKEAWRLLNRISILADTLGLDEEGIEAAVSNTITNPGTFIMPVDSFFWTENISLTQARVEGILWVNKANQLADTLGISQEDLYILIDDYKANAASYTSNSSEISVVYDALGADSKYIKLTIHEFNDIFVKSKQLISTDDIIALFDFFDAIYEDSSLFNIKAADIWAWVWNTSPGSPTTINASISADVLRAVHSNFKEFRSWSDFIVPVKNELRERLRDALVGIYVGSGEFEDANEVYAYYLLDTQMSSCFMTSRIVAAVGSVQLLVHRSLLGLEEGIVIGETDKGQWEWRKNYRVWEANRKVFLYPENWIDPSLRTNKTTLFKEMEDLLQQDEINDSNSETALGNYLVQLHEVANLDVRAMLIESPGGTATTYVNNPDEIIHLFARTWNPPYVYYYRKQIKNVWNAWEKMEVEITGDHLIPVFFNRKLYLFFPLFTEHFKEVTIAGKQVQKKYFQIQMSYTKYDFGKWSQKKVLPAINSAGEFASRWWGEWRLNQKLGEGINHPTGDPYAGAVVWSNSTGDYTKVSMEMEGFYFHPKMHSNGDLEIICRRDFHPDIASSHSGYSEMGYEIGWKISAADERIAAYAPALESSEASGGQRYLSRPYMTKPKAQQMVYGKDNFGNNTISSTDRGLWAKTSQTFYPSSNRLLSATPNGSYILTYPIQYKHNLQSQPFFFRDDLRNFYVKKEGSKHRFYSNNHPYTRLLLEKLNAFGVNGLLNPDNSEPNLLKRQMSLGSNYFPSYTPNTQLVDTTYPRDEFDFALSGPYSLYNWEVFFHSVSLIARQLRLNNKFAEAIRWLNFVFDPTELDSTSPQLLDLRYWQIKPFFQNVSTGSIRNMMRLLSTADATLTQAEKDLKADFKKQIAAWENHPFDPHMLAGMRPRAYMLWTVMEYITTLTDWGDYLFRQDTMESINEAINLYVIASEILGDRPKSVKRPEPTPRCFDELEADLDDFSNALVKIENYLPSLANCNCGQDLGSGMQIVCYDKPLSITVTDLYFCVPGNPKIVEMWDRVDDRLFKIRHCMNIDGKVRSLALFSPPIDPAMLVQAVAGGLSIADALADMAAPLPYYRFTYLLQRANEYCNEVKSLGSQLISLYEKKDAEELSLFRQVQEQNIQNAARALKVMAIEEAKQNYASLELSKTLIQIRLDDYQAREYRNPRELSAMNLTRTADGFMYAEQGVRLIGGLINLIPDVELGADVGPMPAVTTKVKMPFSGEKLSIVVNAAANALGIVTSALRNKASQSLTFASYDRREEDWRLQIKSAKEELAQVDRQLLSSMIRISVTEKELANHDLQVEQSKLMHDWLKNKFTNVQLYSWMIGQVKGVYRQAFNLAYNMAKKAQVSMDYEFGNSGSNIIQYGQWDNAKSGFLAGERLSIQLKQLETEYIESNKRDYELTKNISLALLDPFELEKLKATGKCDIRLPEVLFDIDHPTHYFRRIKSVSISIPCIAGPNTNINATLMMVNHVRRDTNATAGYTAKVPNTSAFGESIATSSSQNDSGVFELNFKDERFVPFEGKGAISNWTLEISSLHVGGASDRLVRQFDFSTITDVVMHMKYTAKEGGGATFGTTVKAAALANLNTFASSIGNSFLYAFSLKHDMPNKWHEFKTGGTTSVSVEKHRLPYIIQALGLTVTGLKFIVERTAPTASSPLSIGLLGAAPQTLTLLSGSTKTYTTNATPSNTALGNAYAIDDHTSIDKTVIDDIIVVANITLA